MYNDVFLLKKVHVVISVVLILLPEADFMSIL